jgi:TM2 domain-containing membrane protein YozV
LGALRSSFAGAARLIAGCVGNGLADGFADFVVTGGSGLLTIILTALLESNTFVLSTVTIGATGHGFLFAEACCFHTGCIVDNGCFRDALLVVTTGLDLFTLLFAALLEG